jgi:transposase
MKDYTEKKIYLGIDVHKVTYSVSAICEGIVVKKATLQANPEGLVTFCRRFFPGSTIESAYEAGFSGFHLHRTLVKNGISNKVIHAAGVEVAVGDRVKTDKRDSLKIATQLAAGRLKGIHVPSEEREEKRALTRLRETFVEHRTTVANQIKALLHMHGLTPANVQKKISLKLIENLKAIPMRDGIKYALNQLIDLWLGLTAKIKKINVEIALQAEQDVAFEEVYRSAPGIGPVSARVLANEIEDMSYFENERQLFSYTGLTPSEHSSGGHVRRGHISRQGKAMLRKILVLAAWQAIRKDRRLKETYERIATKAGGKKAIVAIARRLIGHIRACFRKKCLYETEALNLASQAA